MENQVVDIFNDPYEKLGDGEAVIEKTAKVVLKVCGLVRNFSHPTPIA